MSEKNDYFHYVENVLGVKAILLDPAPVDVVRLVPLLICVENYATYTPEEQDLLAKMVAALKVDLQKIVVVALADKLNYQSGFSVYLVDSPPEVSNEINVSTYSPRKLLQKPELKKIAWSDLQKVILYFKQIN